MNSKTCIHLFRLPKNADQVLIRQKTDQIQAIVSDILKENWNSERFLNNQLKDTKDESNALILIKRTHINGWLIDQWWMKTSGIQFRDNCSNTDPS